MTLNKTFVNKKFFRQTEEVNPKTLEEIRQRFPSPIIGVIGASNPDYDYSPQMGIIAGFMIAKRCHEQGGSIYTGGVDGVGSDVFTGVALYCAKHNVKIPFFVMIPSGYERIVYDGDAPVDSEILPFELSTSYTAIAKITETDLQEVITGKEMSERRLYVAKGGDLLIVINGSTGTMDEAKLAVRHSKDVIVVKSTGGAASAISRWIKNDQLTFNDAQFKFALMTKPTELQKQKFHAIYGLNEIISKINSILKNKFNKNEGNSKDEKETV